MGLEKEREGKNPAQMLLLNGHYSLSDHLFSIMSSHSIRRGKVRSIYM